jgi:tetratricopeptide (TPR) repeat protein
MKKLFPCVALVAFSTIAWALTSLQEVESAVQQGHFARAEAMLHEVIAANPGSARAHYLYAELLARGGNLSDAAEEVKTAKRIDPKITFAEPANFRLFEATLSKVQGRTAGVKRADAFPPAPSLRPSADLSLQPQ